MKKIWINKAKSFKQAEKFNQNYYLKMTETERLEIIQFLREMRNKIGGRKHENREGLRRVIKIIQ